MRTKGVCYDCGRVMLGQNWRPTFPTATVRRELQIIRDDLHCNAVRLQGENIDRLMFAAETALELDLSVWFSPELWDRDADETLAHIERGARAAETLRSRFPDQVVFSVGSEVSLFTQGYFEGRNVLERISHPGFIPAARAGQHNGPLNAFLGRAVTATRSEFHGAITYASVALETVDWSPFDIVGVDMYRDSRIRDVYPKLLQRYLSFGKPLANMEFGCCTFKGAEDLGGRGWDVVDWTQMPPRLKQNYEYDQATQATELGELLRLNDSAGVDATFVFTFQDSAGGVPEGLMPLVRSLSFDPDLVRYGLVKSHLDGTHGKVYPDMTWEPKESFRTVAEYYAQH